MPMDTGHWSCIFDIPIDTYGFIYSIECNINSRKYIGKKQIRRTIKKRPLKGKRNKRHTEVESDWKTYTGSCNDLNADIVKHGMVNFTFTILKLCSCKWEMAYEEARLQFELDVLSSEVYYNGIINCRIGKRPKKLDDCSG